MKLHLDFEGAHHQKADLKVLGAFSKASNGSEGKSQAVLNWEDKELVKTFHALKSSTNFPGSKGSSFHFNDDKGYTYLVIGLGDKKSADEESIRRATAGAFKQFAGKKYSSVSIDTTSFGAISDKVKVIGLIAEALQMTGYSFDKYLSKKTEHSFKQINLYCSDKKLKRNAEKTLEEVLNVTDSINFARDLINEPPNVLHSEEYAKRIEQDVKTALKGRGVKVTILGKADLKKEKMGCFLAVNAGSAHEPRLVHLTYTPKKATKNTKHFALVGKGLTFDTGGYSLKPGASMMNMKFDMGGSATVYGAFRAAVLNNSPYKLTCILGMTDNKVSEHATTPDSIVTARNGKTVEILNTDAEGRLVLADCLDYASDLKPNYIIDAATLTGACLVALGSEVCAVLGNDDKFIKKVQDSAKSQHEYSWQLPIIEEWRDDMKSKVADLKNIGTAGRAGTATAAAFLENFIGEGIAWAHLDVAGVADSQSHLPYCPAKGASGIMIRSLHHLMVHGK